MNDAGIAREGGDVAAADLVDRARYPIDRLDEPEGQAFVARCRGQLRAEGVCTLAGFITPAAQQAMAAEAIRALPQAFFCRNTHNAYLEPDDDRFPADHPRRRRLRTDVGSVAADRLPPDGLLHRLYGWDAMTDFVGAVLERRPFYRLADPLGAVSINVFRPGDAHSWHFDESEYTTTLMLQEAESGGAFEYVPAIRPAEGEDHEAVGRVLDGDRAGIRRLPFGAGTLSIFGGRRALHRVTEVGGGRPRLVAVLCYNSRPGIANSDAVRMLFWGRTR
jgi:hypothetical protein